MSKINLPDIGSLANTTSARSAINSNFNTIKNAIDNTISRDGTAPNQMEADFDLNDHQLLNVADPVNEADGVNLRSVRPLVEQFAGEIAETLIEGTARVERFIATAGQTDFPLTSSPGSTANTYVFDSGIAQTPDLDFTLTGTDLTTLQFFVGRSVDSEIVVRYVELGPSDSILRGDLNNATSGQGASLVKTKQTGTGAVDRDMRDKGNDRASVFDYIPAQYHADIKANTSTYDCTADFNAALTAHKEVFIPPGKYRILGQITVPQGHMLVGAGRRKVTLEIPSTFNLAATGVLYFPSAEPGPEVCGFTMEFEQPDSAVAGDYTAYPPAIYAQTCPRFKVSNLRIAKAWNGIDLKGNSGGAVIDDVEMSMFNIGIDIDGALDSIKINKFHLWPFGTGTSSFTTNNRTVFATAYGIKSGRCDDFHLSDSLIFSVTKGVYFYNSASGRTFGNIVNVDFDDRGGLQLDTNADICCTACVFTLGKTDSRLIYMTGGTLQLSTSRFRADVINTGVNAPIEITGGTATFSNCQMFYLSNDNQFLYWTNATVNVIGGTLIRNANIAYTITFMRASTGAKGVVSGLFCSDLGTGSSKMIQIDADTGVVVTGNYTKGWTVQTPSGALSVTRVHNNLGASSNKDEFVGYFSSDASTTVKLPTGWSISKAGTGNYAITHGLSTSDAKDMLVTATCDNTANGGIAQWDITNSSTSAFRIRTYVGTTATDMGVAFRLNRFRVAQ